MFDARMNDIQESQLEAASDNRTWQRARRALLSFGTKGKRPMMMLERSSLIGALLNRTEPGMLALSFRRLD